MADKVSDKFKGSVGDGKGLDVPTYDVQSVGIVINRTNGAVMVHEPVGVAARIAGLGTGKLTSDAIVVYTKEDFEKKYSKSGSWVTFEQFKKDAERLAPIVYSTGRGNPNVEVALDMQTRVQEINNDMAAFREKLRLMNDVAPKGNVDTSLKIPSPYQK